MIFEDQYLSTGGQFYELLTGRLPFPGENYQMVLHGLLNVDPPPVTKYRNDVPPAVHRILGRAMTKDRELRYASAELMLMDLRNWNTALAGSLCRTPLRSSRSRGCRPTACRSAR